MRIKLFLKAIGILPKTKLYEFGYILPGEKLDRHPYFKN
jgi:hypothetical protein